MPGAALGSRGSKRLRSTVVFEWPLAFCSALASRTACSKRRSPMIPDAGSYAVYDAAIGVVCFDIGQRL